MKATLREFLTNLGIDGEFGPYDSRMWSADDDEKGITCTAMASMSGEGNEMDITVDIVHTPPKPDTPESESIMFCHAKQDMNKKWTPDVLRVKKEVQSSKIYDWEKKMCDFFVAVTAVLNRGEVPDLDALIERIFKSADNFGSGTASGGSRKPMIRPEQLLDPTKRF